MPAAVLRTAWPFNRLDWHESCIIEIKQPVGTYLVTASASGYRSKSQAVVVPENDQAEVGFTLASRSGIVVSASASPGRIPPDGETTSTISAWVRDLEGGLLANKEVTFATDAGVLSATSATTNSSGVAQVTLTAGTDPDTATVTATCEGITARVYVEFGSATAPWIRINSPMGGATISGGVALEAEFGDDGGTDIGCSSLAYALDGQFLASTDPVLPNAQLVTCSLSNGTHTLEAAVMDGDREESYSQRVTFTVENPVENLHPNRTMVLPDTPGEDTVTFEGDRADGGSGPWQVEIWAPDGTEPVRTFSGSGPHISATWDGRDAGGVASTGAYGAKVLLTDTGQSCTSDHSVLVPIDHLWEQPTALVVDALSESSAMDLAVSHRVKKTLERAGYNVMYLNPANATWNMFCSYMGAAPQVLYVHAHGQFVILPGRKDGPFVTAFMLKDAMVYSNRPKKADRTYFPEYPPPGGYAWPNLNKHKFKANLKAHYITELADHDTSRLRLVFMNGCLMGRVGARKEEDWSDPETPYGGSVGNGNNDMAWFMNVLPNAHYRGAAYIGFYEKAYTSTAPAYVYFPGALFSAMAGGRSLRSALDGDEIWGFSYYDEVLHRQVYPFLESPQGEVSDKTKPVYPWGVIREYLPVWDNLRVFGDPFQTYLPPQ